MTVYAVIMSAAAVLFFALGAAVYGGKTGLIHSYHQENVDESQRACYGRTMGRGLILMGASMALSGAVALICGRIGAAIAVLLSGIAVSIGIMIYAQKKYNGGIF